MILSWYLYRLTIFTVISWERFPLCSGQIHTSISCNCYCFSWLLICTFYYMPYNKYIVLFGHQSYDWSGSICTYLLCKYSYGNSGSPCEGRIAVQKLDNSSAAGIDPSREIVNNCANEVKFSQVRNNFFPLFGTFHFFCLMLGVNFIS